MEDARPVRRTVLQPVGEAAQVVGHAVASDVGAGGVAVFQQMAAPLSKNVCRVYEGRVVVAVEAPTSTRSWAGSGGAFLVGTRSRFSYRSSRLGGPSACGAL
jgi:hypothetical protein